MVDERNTQGLSVEGAVEQLERALAYDAPLRMRGEGLSWMVWGLVSAVVILVFEGVADLPYQIWYPFVPFVWAAMGILGTAAVWRLAGVARPALTPPTAKVVLAVVVAMVGLVLMVAAGWMIYDATGSWIALTLAMAGIPWGLLGWAQWNRMTQAGRRAMIVAGVVMALLFTVYVEFLGTGTRAPDILMMAASTGGIPFLLGLVWTFRR